MAEVSGFNQTQQLFGFQDLPCIPLFVSNSQCADIGDSNELAGLSDGVEDCLYRQVVDECLLQERQSRAIAKSTQGMVRCVTDGAERAASIAELVTSSAADALVQRNLYTQRCDPIREKPVGYIMGEWVVRPAIDRISRIASWIWGKATYSFS